MSMCLYRHLDVHGGLSCGPLGGRSCGLRSAPNGEGESRRSLPSHASRASWSRCIPRRRGDLACGRLVSRSRTAITKVTPVDRGRAQGPRVPDTHASKAPHGSGVQGLTWAEDQPTSTLPSLMRMLATVTGHRTSTEPVPLANILTVLTFTCSALHPPLRTIAVLTSSGVTDSSKPVIRKSAVFTGLWTVATSPIRSAILPARSSAILPLLARQGPRAAARCGAGGPPLSARSWLPP